MSVSLLEVIEAGGYDITTFDDANWLLSKQNEFEDLIIEAQDVIDNTEDDEEDTATDELNDIAKNNCEASPYWGNL